MHGLWKGSWQDARVCETHVKAVFDYSFAFIAMLSAFRCHDLRLVGRLKHLIYAINSLCGILWQITRQDFGEGHVSNRATAFVSATKKGEKLNVSSTWVAYFQQDSVIARGEIVCIGLMVDTL